ncbi:MAG: helix-turn-helix transcriptional regulator [Salinivirgaceae bacterium]
MIQLIAIITIILCLVLGFYTIALLQIARNRYDAIYLNSFFYYQVLTFLFGIYGILGNLLIREILPKFDVNFSGIETAAQLFPFIGLPFLIAAWYMKLKMTAELCKKKTHKYIPFIYFTLTTLVFLAYGLAIKKIPEINVESHKNLQQYIFLGFATIEMIVEGYIVIFLFIHSFGQEQLQKKLLLSRIALIIIALTLLKAASLYFSQIHFAIGLYFLLLFFAGNLPIVFLIRVFLGKNESVNTVIINIEESLFQKFKITPREKEIIIEICRGNTNQQIADKMFITLQTVKDHTHNIFQKTEVKNRVQLSQLFARNSTN